MKQEIHQKMRTDGLEKAYIELLERRHWDLLITLTFRRRVADYEASSALQKWAMWCQDKIKQELIYAPLMEYKNDNWHYHILVVKPEGWRSRDLKALFESKWRKIRIHGHANLGNRDWFKEIGCSDLDQKRTSLYSLKQTKQGYLPLDGGNF